MSIEVQARTDIVCEFLEVALHCILSARKLYPDLAFVNKRKYNIPVQVAIHPDVEAYIKKCIEAIAPLISTNEVECIVVSILNAFQKPIEQFVFDITLPTEEIQLDTYLYEVEQCFRDFCLKINTSAGILKRDTSQCTFAVHVHTKRSGAEKLLNKEEANVCFPWVEAENCQVFVEKSQLVPLKSMDTPICKMQLYVIENEQT